MRAYGWSPRFCRSGITAELGWVWYCWAKENEATMMGRLWKRSGKGYIGQEAERLFNDAKARRHSRKS